MINIELSELKIAELIGTDKFEDKYTKAKRVVKYIVEKLNNGLGKEK